MVLCLLAVVYRVEVMAHEIMIDCSDCIYENHCQDAFRRLIMTDGYCRFYDENGPGDQ